MQQAELEIISMLGSRASVRGRVLLLPRERGGRAAGVSFRGRAGGRLGFFRSHFGSSHFGPSNSFIRNLFFLLFLGLLHHGQTMLRSLRNGDGYDHASVLSCVGTLLILCMISRMPEKVRQRLFPRQMFCLLLADFLCSVVTTPVL